MKIYTLRLNLRGVSPLVWRRLRVPGITSLATLHEMIQIVNHWDNDHLHCFHIYAVDYGISYAGGLDFRKNAYKVFLDNFDFSIGDKFYYEYNFSEPYIVDIRIEAITEKNEENKNNKKIMCVQGNGMPDITKLDVSHAYFKVLKTIAKMKSHTKLTKFLSLIEKFKETQFNRKRINQRLLSEITL